MSQVAYNILFLCSANSARSLMAEAIMRREGAGKFTAFSAGSQPAGTPNPNAMSLLEREDFSAGQFRSKSWDEFASETAPQLDFVVTLCDQAAGETCPVWPGQPMLAHWGIQDPAKFQGNEAQTAMIFAKAYAQIRNRITAFTNLPIESLDRLSLKTKMDEIGQMSEDAV